VRFTLDSGLFRALRLAAGLAVGGVFVALFVSRASLEPVSDRLAAADATWLACALAFMTVNIGLGIVRWTCLVRASGRHARFAAAAPTVLAARAANDLLPLRAGELLKVASARDRLGLPAWLTAGTLILERLLDAVAIAGILLCGAAVIGGPGYAFEIGGVLLALAVAGFAVVARLSRHGAPAHPRWASLPRWVRAAAADVRGGAAAARRPRPLALAAGVSLVMWLMELGMFVAVGHAVDLRAPFGSYMVIQALGNLGLAIPGAPAAIGTFDFVALVVSRQVAGAHAGVAATYVLIAHAYLIVPSALIGAFAVPFALPRAFALSRGRAAPALGAEPVPESPPRE
jgi:uncharacterized membrane protein YbhN (UPF0104 family)